MAKLEFDPSVGHERFKYTEAEMAKMRRKAREYADKIRARQAALARAAGLTLEEYLDPFRTLRK